MPQRRGFTRTRSYRPSGVWAGLVNNAVTVPASTALLLASFTPSPSFMETVRRTHISLLFSSDQNVASENVVGAIGAGVFTDHAIAIGAASLPDPVTDVGDDIWFMFQGLHSRFSFSAGGGIAETAGSLYEIDSKAMRKVPNGKSVAIIIANASATAGAVVQLTTRIYSTITRA